MTSGILRAAGALIIALAASLPVPANACTTDGNSPAARMSREQKLRLAFERSDAVVEAMVEDDWPPARRDAAPPVSPITRAIIVRSWKGSFRPGDSVPTASMFSTCSFAPIRPPVRMILFLGPGGKSEIQGHGVRYGIDYGMLKPDLIESDPAFAVTRADLDRLAAAAGAR